MQCLSLPDGLHEAEVALDPLPSGLAHSTSHARYVLRGVIGPLHPESSWLFGTV